MAAIAAIDVRRRTAMCAASSGMGRLARQAAITEDHVAACTAIRAYARATCPWPWRHANRLGMDTDLFGDLLPRP